MSKLVQILLNALFKCDCLKEFVPPVDDYHLGPGWEVPRNFGVLSRHPEHGVNRPNGGGVLDVEGKTENACQAVEWLHLIYDESVSEGCRIPGLGNGKMGMSRTIHPLTEEPVHVSSGRILNGKRKLVRFSILVRIPVKVEAHSLPECLLTQNVMEH